MQEVFEKIVEKLKEKSIYMTTRDGYGANCVSVGTIEKIVKQTAEQYNNGWIPCSERLPENDCYCLVTNSDMEICIREYGYSKGFGWDGFERIIAWQPLPQPYHPKGE